MELLPFDQYFQVSVEGVPLVLVVLGLVTWLWKLGLKDQPLMIAGMVVGLLLGGGYQISQLGFPTTFGGWFAILVYGIGLGLLASGIYETGKKLSLKAAGLMLLGNLQEKPEDDSPVA